MNAVWKHCKGFLFRLFPHHAVSRLTFWATRLRTPLKNPAIRLFIRKFKVDMTQASHPNPEDYASFNEFFTRRLVPGTRPVASGDDAVVSPADGYISQISSYSAHQAVQAKGRVFSMLQLLGGTDEYGRLCEHGKFATVYLSPSDYHRVHMPLDGTLVEMIHIPGRLFSVAPYAAETVSNLFARNERVVSIFKTCTGYMAVVMVGAVNVAAIETAWHGLVTPPRGKAVHRQKYPGVELKKGEELGVFNMGSTAIVAFDSDSIEWDPEIRLQQPVRMGQALGRITGSFNPKPPASP